MNKIRKNKSFEFYYSRQLEFFNRFEEYEQQLQKN